MSPLLGRRKVEEAIDLSSNGEMRIRREKKDGEIQVIWPCGDTYTFQQRPLWEIIQYVEMYGTEVWLSFKDLREQQFYLHLDQDVLSMGNVPGNAYDSAAWTPLKDALEEAIEA